MRIKYSDEARNPRSHMRDPDAQSLVAVGDGSGLDKKIREAYSVTLRAIADKLIYTNSLGRFVYFVPHSITTEFVPGRGTLAVLLRCRPPSEGERQVEPAPEEAAPHSPDVEVDESGPWERIPNPLPGGPYWQPSVPEARYFWRELLEANERQKKYETLYYQLKADLAVAELQGRYRPNERTQEASRPDRTDESAVPRYG